MAIPDFQTVMLPLLKLAGDKKEHSKHEAVDILAKEFRLTEAELHEMLPSGRQGTFDNRVGWAVSYLKKAGLFEYPKPRKGIFLITDDGLETLRSSPARISIAFLRKFPQFAESERIRQHMDTTAPVAEALDSETPEEVLEASYQRLEEDLAAQLLERLSNCSPKFFEIMVVDLLVAMGYGGSRKDAGQAVGATGDGGIDGLIKEDKLGLDTVYIQAKRWQNTVGIGEIQHFSGSLDGVKARKGVFITTSQFAKNAKDYVKHIDKKIVLIDGKQLTELMIEHGVGVTEVSVYRVCRVDEDYFIEE